MLYLFISIAEIVLHLKKNSKKIISASILKGIISLFFVIWLIIGVGIESIISGVILLSLCIPIYIYQKKNA
tara:strand:- start:416 stop:628 length:213 start_codon:yes stop_codon:yes gene_type:complete